MSLCMGFVRPSFSYLVRYLVRSFYIEVFFLSLFSYLFR